MLYYVAKCPLKCIYITKIYKETVLMDKKAAVARIEEIMREKGITREQFEQNAEVADTVKQWKRQTRCKRFAFFVFDYKGVRIFGSYARVLFHFGKI